MMDVEESSILWHITKSGVTKIKALQIVTVSHTSFGGPARTDFFQDVRVRQTPINASGVNLQSVNPMLPSFHVRRSLKNGLLKSTELNNVKRMQLTTYTKS